jgi:calcium/calmodulin-dependent protein kinase I
MVSEKGTLRSSRPAMNGHYRFPLSKLHGAWTCRVNQATETSSHHSFDNELGWRQSFDDIQVMSSIGSSAFGKVRRNISRQIYHHVPTHGHSAHAQVFMGKMEGHDELVAVKRMPKERGKQSRARTIEKIQLEATTLGMMGEHPGVAHLLATYEDADFVHIVTKLCPGGDLQKWSEAIGPLDETTLSLCALEMTRVISECHVKGIVHGDIKPGNFCLSDPSQHLFPYLASCPAPQQPSPTSSIILDHLDLSQRPPIDLKYCLKAIDFGSAQILGKTKRSSRRTGTPAFMSPQVFARDYGCETDVWSLGVSLYWLKSNQLPFLHGGGGMRKIEDLEAAVNNNEISFNSEHFSGMSSIGIEFISRCLCRSERDRMTAREALSHPWLVSAADNQVRLVEDYISDDPISNVLDAADWLKSRSFSQANK